MTLRDSIKAGIPLALKAKEKTKLDTLRALLSEIQYEEIQKKVEPLPDQETISILKREVKKRVESLDFAVKAERTEMIADLKAEIAVIESLLPSQLSEEKIRSLFTDWKSELPNMGALMKKLKDEYNGQYDSKLASDIAKSIF